MRERLARLDQGMAERLGRDIVKLSQESLEGDDEITGNS
jgi:hypothetical protein